jgi:tetratricopeptide (TPR) repeat protein
LYSKNVALDKLGKHEDAIKYFDKAIEIYPRNQYALCRKGVALDKLGKDEEARESYEKSKMTAKS